MKAIQMIDDSHDELTLIIGNRDEIPNNCQESNVFGIPGFIAMQYGKELGRCIGIDRKTKDETLGFIKTLPSHKEANPCK